MPKATVETCGVLISGGLGNAVMAARPVDENTFAQPTYVRCGLIWELPKLKAAEQIWAQTTWPERLTRHLLDQPMGDRFGTDWAVNGRGAPRIQRGRRGILARQKSIADSPGRPLAPAASGPNARHRHAVDEPFCRCTARFFFLIYSRSFAIRALRMSACHSRLAE